MFFLISVVVLLIVITYSMDSKSGSTSSRRSNSKNPFQGRFDPSTDSQTDRSIIDKGQLMRCHQCSCFFSPIRVVSTVVDGHVLEFCSANCRNHFVNSIKT